MATSSNPHRPHPRGADSKRGVGSGRVHDGRAPDRRPRSPTGDLSLAEFALARGRSRPTLLEIARQRMGRTRLAPSAHAPREPMQHLEQDQEPDEEAPRRGPQAETQQAVSRLLAQLKPGGSSRPRSSSPKLTAGGAEGDPDAGISKWLSAARQPAAPRRRGWPARGGVVPIDQFQVVLERRTRHERCDPGCEAWRRRCGGRWARAR